MKQVMCLFILACVCACQKPYEKAIDEYVNANFNDPSSYECVELGKPQELTTIRYAMEQVKTKAKAEGWSADSLFKKTTELRPYLKEHGNNPDEVLLRYCEHTYRATNAFGANVLHKEKWYFNEDYTKVTNIEKE